MSVSSATSGMNLNPSSLKGLTHQRHKDFDAIASSIQSGDISGAQAALTAFQTDMQNIQGNKGISDPQGGQQPSKLQTDFSNLVSSIQSGSTTGAQSALSTLQQDRQSQVGAASGSPQASFKQDLASLIQAVQAGDLSTAQQDATKVQSDMKEQGAGHHHHKHGGNDALSSIIDAISGNNANSNSANASATSAYSSMMTELQATSSISTLA